MTSRAKSTKVNKITDTTPPIEEVSATKKYKLFFEQPNHSYYLGLGATVIQSANEFHRGLILKKQADAELELGLGKATLSFFNYIQDIANHLLQSTTKKYRNLLNARGQTDSAMLKNMLIFEAEYAKLLA